MTVREIMKTPIPVWVRAPLEAAWELMEAEGTDYLVVVDGACVVGLLTEAALDGVRDDADAWTLSVGAVMEPIAEVIGPDQSLLDAVAHFSAEPIDALVVIDGQRLLGVLTREDVLHAPSLRRLQRLCA